MTATILLALLLAQPKALACLERHYAARAEAAGLRLHDGAFLPYDDGRTKTPEQRLDDPDIEDVFAWRYFPGPITPVVTPDHDPGRARLPSLLAATYPPGELVPIRFLAHRIRVHRRAAPAFRRVATRLARLPATPALARLGGTYNDRVVAGTTRRSAHAFGIAIDLDPAWGHYWRWDRPPRWRNRIPQAVVDAFEAEGFIWGGRWYHYDTMHFEYRPELLDPACWEPR